jgi:radical SAM-linked protein
LAVEGSEVAQFVCRYRKGEKARWISHLDVKRTLERAMRRAGLPLELTAGHNPRPKLSLGPPLALGATGDGELLALHLREAMEPAEVKQRLSCQLPLGLEIVEAWRVPAHKKKETFGQVDVAEYTIVVSNGVSKEELEERLRNLMQSHSLLVQRGGQRRQREVDLRPLIVSLTVARAERREVELHARLKTGSHGGARPQEVVSLLGLDEDGRVARYHRTGLYASAEAPSQHRGGVWRRWTRSRSSREGSQES